MYHNQIVHHKPYFNLFIRHNNLFDNQGSEINKNDKRYSGEKTKAAFLKNISTYCLLQFY